MRVGLVVEDIAPEAGGGYTITTEIVHALVRCPAARAHTFTVFSPASRLPDQFQGNPAIRFVSLHRSRAKKIGDTLRQVVRKLVANLRHPADPPYVRSAFEEFGLQLFRQSGIEMIFYVHQYFLITLDIPYLTIVWDLQHRLQPYFPEVSNDGRWEKREKVSQRALQRASVVIAGTQAGKREIEQFYHIPAERIRILPHPTPLFAFPNAPAPDNNVLTKYHLPERYVLYPAQFWPHKNHVRLLMAVKLLQEQDHLVFPVVLVGSDKGNAAYIRQVIDDLHLRDHVYCLGFVPPQDLVALYRAAFALTYLTFFGPENMPPLEAFALGCPVIASDVPGAQEQLGDAAVLVDPQDEGQLASAIKSLHENPHLRQTLIKRGLERAAQWTSNDFANGLVAILDEFVPLRQCWK